jgi:lactoylglutathione lyase
MKVVLADVEEAPLATALAEIEAGGASALAVRTDVQDGAAVDALAARFAAGGIAVLEGPRRTGDGYYECVVRDPEGNRVEIAAG